MIVLDYKITQIKSVNFTNYVVNKPGFKFLCFGRAHAGHDV